MSSEKKKDQPKPKLDEQTKKLLEVKGAEKDKLLLDKKQVNK